MSRGHPGRLELERFSVDDLPRLDRERVTTHVGGCPDCQSYLEGLQAFTDARLAAVPPARFMAQLDEQRGASKLWLSWRTGLGSLAAAAATATLVWLVFPGLMKFNQEDEALKHQAPQVLFKGAGVAVHRKRGDRVGVLSDGAPVRAGDALRVVITLSRPAPVAVWFVDISGRVDRLHPSDRLMLSSGEHPLEGSAVVERPCTGMWLLVALGDAASREQALKAAVSGGVPDGLSWVPPGTMARFLPCE